MGRHARYVAIAALAVAARKSQFGWSEVGVMKSGYVLVVLSLMLLFVQATCSAAKATFNSNPQQGVSSDLQQFESTQPAVADEIELATVRFFVPTVT